MRYFQVKAVRSGTWEENHTIVIGFRSVDEETRGEMEKKSVLEEALQQANKANRAKTAPFQYVTRYKNADECR